MSNESETETEVEAEADDPRFDVIVLGRKIGTASGYDVMDTNVLCFYEFEQVEAFDALRTPNRWKGDVTIDGLQGTIYKTNNDGEVILSTDIVPLLLAPGIEHTDDITEIGEHN